MLQITGDRTQLQNLLPDSIISYATKEPIKDANGVTLQKEICKGRSCILPPLLPANPKLIVDGEELGTGYSIDSAAAQEHAALQVYWEIIMQQPQ
jgi:hypothetical protein